MKKLITSILISCLFIGAASARSYQIVPDYTKAGGFIVKDPNGNVLASWYKGPSYAGGQYLIINDPYNIVHVTYSSSLQVTSIEID